MTFAIEVGEVSRERIDFTFNQLLGRTVIRANGRELKRNTRWFSEPVVETHLIDLTETERVQVKIEKRRKHLFSSQYFVYVNDRMVQYYRGI
jgi:hypothetical protein